MLNALHILWAWIEEKQNEIHVWWTWWKISKWKKNLYLWNAWTAVRFLASFAWVSGQEISIDWNDRMRQRPLGDLLEWLISIWANVESENCCVPVKIIWSKYFPDEVHVKWNTSSQYLSWLLQIAPLLPNWLTIIVIWDLVSKPYIDLTLDVMRGFNVYVDNQWYKKFIIKNQKYASTIYDVEADASSASYWTALAAFSKSKVTINLPYSSIQWDSKFVDILERIWADVIKDWKQITVKWNSDLKEIWEIDLNDMPDVAMTLAVLAALLPWTTRIVNVENMRVKECDRIKAIVTQLKKLWVDVIELRDWIEVKHCEKFVSWVQIETYDDHRIAMCFSILWLIIWWIEILDPDCTSKTYPNFFDEVKALY